VGDHRERGDERGEQGTREVSAKFQMICGGARINIIVGANFADISTAILGIAPLHAGILE
jgi:hypothetical protein